MSEIIGYKILENVYESDTVLIRRGQREADGSMVIIKSYKATYPGLKDLAKLRHEHELVSGVESEHIIKSFSVEKAGNGLALIRENFVADSLDHLIGKGLSLNDFFPIAIELTNALASLHRYHIIHKDIKPSNILIGKTDKKVRLTDFGISTRLSKETQNISNPGKLEGSLAFMSPEQTGRMNRNIDYRSDFYSLGVTFYQMLTGVLPFNYNDPVELVHAHIAIKPIPVHEVNNNIPVMLSEIIVKLMAKTAEDRYRSALGLKADLETCAKQWKENGRIDTFTLGNHDVSETFQISQKLYGREKEITELLGVFEDVSEGEARLMLVSGYSGTGKSSLVNEIHKPILRQKGFFIAGKFDQFKRNVPYDSLIQAFGEMTRQLLTESDEKISNWKERLLTALGPNAQLIIDVIPEVELIIGKQPSVAPLPPSESQHRFNTVFQSFISVFTTKQHPLVVFLDDLQWADSGSLKIIKNLITDSASRYLYLIGAYRDNEVDGTHPLSTMLEELTKAGKTVNKIHVKPLSQEDLIRLIADSFFITGEKTNELAGLVFSKTQGNPFFIIEFLKTLYQENLLSFDFNSNTWVWDVKKIKDKDITDNVVDLMTGKIQKLSTSTQNILKLASSIGNQIDLETLSIVNEISPVEAINQLWEAIEEGMINHLNENYRMAGESGNDASNILFKFQHDRVQQAAYSLISESEKPALHLKIGQLLWKKTTSESIDEKVFDIVNQINFGIDLISDQKDRLEIAKLNVKAGMRAKDSTAYDSAFRYFETAKSLLPKSPWKEEYPLTFSIFMESAECAYLLGNHPEAEKNFDIILENAANKLDQSKVYYLKITLYTTIYNFPGAMEVGKIALKLFDEELPENIDEAMGAEIGKVMTNPVMQNMDSILTLPEMTDPERIELARIIAVLQTPAYYTNTNLWTLLVSKQMNFALTYGNSTLAPMGYLGFALILGNAIGDFAGADKLGLISLKINEKYQGKENLAKLHMVHYAMNNHYKHHVKTNIPECKVALQYAVETGDLIYCHFSILHIMFALFYMNAPAEEILTEIDKYDEFFRRVPNEMSDVLTLYRQLCLSLRGETTEPGSLGSDIFNEAEFHEKLTKNLNPIPLFNYDMVKMQILYMHGKYAEAIALSSEAEKVIAFSYANYSFSEFFYLNAIILAALYPYVDAEKQVEFNTNMDVLQAKMKAWSDACPENWMHKYLFVEAERAKNMGELEKVSELYDEAISFANANELLLDSALINEKAGEFYISNSKEEKAIGYLRDAHYFYKQWGAKTKTNELEAKYPNIIVRKKAGKKKGTDTLISYSTTTTGESSTMLDLVTVMKSAQALSSEIDLSSLLEKVTSIMIENAGAERGMLILEQNGEWVVQAEGEAGENEIRVLHEIPLKKAGNLCHGVINYVLRTQLHVVLEDALNEGAYMNDDYIISNKIRSVLCTPVMHQGKLSGILYLENNLTADAFTQDRIEVLNILSSQAAISIENAKLYTDLREEIDERKRAQDELRESEQKLAQYLEAIPVGVFVINKEGKPHYANEKAKLLLGQGIVPEASVEHLTETYQAYVANTDIEYPNHDAPIVRALRGESITIDNMEIHKDGFRIPIEVSATPIYDAAGKIIFAIAAFQDITQRLLAKKQLEEYSHTLEVRVTERTAELNEKKKNLEVAIEGLKKAQSQLVQAEKMASIGQLTAGIAHEINNPINFVSANILPLKRDVEDVLKTIDKYDAFLREAVPHKMKEMDDFRKEIDLDYSVKEIHELLDGIESGALRTKEIVEGLRNFSRLDENVLKETNIHEGLDSSISLLYSRLGEHIKINKSYGEVPEIKCFPGSINQVFMNILTNAIQAIKTDGEINISTRKIKEGVQITIADTGEGIAPENKTRIFEPFFTTRDVGQGKGLGLSIAYGIIENHKGKIQVDSTVGRGTTFKIIIPDNLNRDDFREHLN